MIVAARVGKPLKLFKFNKNDFTDLEEKIKAIDFAHDRIVVAIEGLYR